MTQAVSPIHFDHVLGAFPPWAQSMRNILTLKRQGMGIDIQHRVAQLETTAVSAQHMLLAMAEYADSGHQVFNLGPRLQELFLETALKGMTLDMLRPPYRGFYLATPGSKFQCWGGPRTEFHSLAGMYVHFVRPNAVTVVGWGEENDKSRQIGDDASIWFRLNLRQYKPGEVFDLDQVLADQIEDPTQSVYDPEITFPEERKTEILAANWDTHMGMLRLAFNTILYLNSRDPELDLDDTNPRARREIRRKLKSLGTKLRGKAKKQARKLQSKLDRLATARITTLGRSIELVEEDPAVDEDAVSSAKTGRRMARHRRRGHWHRYWTGSRKGPDGERVKGERMVHKWVQPTWVNKDLADSLRVKGRVYQFEEDPL